MNVSDWMATGEIAERLGVSLPTVRQLLKAHSVPVVVLVRAWRVRREDAEAFIKKVLGDELG